MLAIQRIGMSLAAVFGLGSAQAACSAEALDPQTICKDLQALVQGGPLRDGPLDEKKTSTVLTWERNVSGCQLKVSDVVGEEGVPGAKGAKVSWSTGEALFFADGPCERFDWSCAPDGASVVRTPHDGEVVFRPGGDPDSVDVTFPGGHANDLRPE